MNANQAPKHRNRYDPSHLKPESGAALVGTSKSSNIDRSGSPVLGEPALYALAPQFEALSLEGLAHQCADLVLLQAKLHLDRLKRRAILPGHLHDAIAVLIRQLLPHGKGTTANPLRFPRRIR